MMPTVVLSELIPTRIPGKYKCREVWQDLESERIFNIYLDVVLLVIPLLIMILVYSLIARKLCLGSRLHFSKKNITVNQNEARNQDNRDLNLTGPSSSNGVHQRIDSGNVRPRSTPPMTLGGSYDKNQAAKTRVVRMLFVVVVEFFICWTPLYVVNTWALFDPKAVYSFLGYAGIAVVQLLAYISSCCNPLTYCFMHKKYRQGFLAVIGCKRNKRWHYNQASERSGTMVSVFSTRAGSVRSGYFYTLGRGRQPVAENNVEDVALTVAETQSQSEVAIISARQKLLKKAKITPHVDSYIQQKLRSEELKPSELRNTILETDVRRGIEQIR